MLSGKCHEEGCIGTWAQQTGNTEWFSTLFYWDEVSCCGWNVLQTNGTSLVVWVNICLSLCFVSDDSVLLTLCHNTAKTLLGIIVNYVQSAAVNQCLFPLCLCVSSVQGERRTPVWLDQREACNAQLNTGEWNGRESILCSRECLKNRDRSTKFCFKRFYLLRRMVQIQQAGLSGRTQRSVIF